ncbi:hypothetical protein [Maribacter sp. R77961]
MKNKRTFLASIALGIFLLATVAPMIVVDQELNIDKRKIRKKI